VYCVETHRHNDWSCISVPYYTEGFLGFMPGFAGQYYYDITQTQHLEILERIPLQERSD